MADPLDEISELLLTGCENANPVATISLWNYNSSNKLQTYKGGGIGALRTLNQVGNDYLLLAEKAKPLLHLWPLNSQETIKELRMVLPEQTNAVVLSPDNVYLAAAIGLKVYVWQLSSGVLLNVLQNHLQAITCVRFSKDGSVMLAASKEGSVVAYRFSSEDGIAQASIPAQF